ncbi:MAG: DUF2279 domain-containing protein [Bacteroidales bacterium]|nr:DUF2279 domain-containing protein [Bacteroidales bacterium]
MLKRLFILFFALILLNGVFAQDTIAPRNKRLTPTLAVASTAYVGGMTGLYFLWYTDYPQSSFHTINDNAAWLQIDKLGHSLTAYHLGKSSYSILKWAGMPQKKALWIGGLSGVVFQTSVEVLDGFSSNWGFSWGDFAANMSGTSLFIGQELLWNEQRISLKFSYFPTKYAQYNPAVLGGNFQERMLKDYNAQTYWLSVNIASFLPEESKIPKWLNIAFGYGAKGMLNSYSNVVSGNDNTPSYTRTRQYYFSLDIDLSKIKTKSEFLSMLLDVASVIKVPFPAIEFNKENGMVFHPFYF